MQGRRRGGAASVDSGCRSRSRIRTGHNESAREISWRSFWVRLAEVPDADTVRGLLRDCNDEFDTAGPTAAEFAGRFYLLLARGRRCLKRGIEWLRGAKM